MAAPDKWGKARVEFHTLTSQKTSGETTNKAILITTGVGKRDLGLVTVFCCCNQAKMEACDTLSTLHQCDSPEPSVVVVRRYSNTPCIPQGMICLFYLDVGTFSGGITSAQFLLDRLHLHWLLPISRTDILLPHEVGEEGLETYSHLPEFLWDGLEEEHRLSDPISLSVTPTDSSAIGRTHSD